MAGADPATYRTLCRENAPFDRRCFLSKAIAKLAIPLRRPFVSVERRKHHEAILAHELTAPPVFIIGHWRSGTTFLHNVLSKDERFGSINFAQSAMPWDFLGRFQIGKALIGLILPETRGMDDVKVGTDEPQEEEIGLGLMQRLSFFNAFYFPREARRHFREGVLLEGVSDADREEFTRQYSYLVKKVSYANGGKRILFKNPASTARVELLAELFPGARFIHIVRNPVEVYASTLKLWDRLLDGFSWQDFSNFDADAHTREFYPALMNAFLDQRERLPAEQVIDVHYDELTANPLSTVESVYRRLGFDFTDDAQKRISRYLDSLADYTPNTHQTDGQLEDSLRKDWGEVTERLGL
ncbi:MAG: sulfotransferase [Verrucomicrobiota bacterium]